MGYYSYLVEHDFGLAPNPFGKYCTLAVCKPKIRKSNKLQINDWVIGTGSKALEDISRKKLRYHLIYVMQVSEIILMEDYWSDPRFEYKKPIINGPLATMYGDNFYHKDSSGNWIQEDSAHSLYDGKTNEEHLKTDTSGKNVLVAELFYYFGDKAPLIPKQLQEICHTTLGEKKLSIEKGEKFDNMVQEYHSLKISEPLVTDKSIAFVLSMDLTMKGRPREQMKEICVYDVKDGKIVSEQFHM